MPESAADPLGAAVVVGAVVELPDEPDELVGALVDDVGELEGDELHAAAPRANAANVTTTAKRRDNGVIWTTSNGKATHRSRSQVALERRHPTRPRIRLKRRASRSRTHFGNERIDARTIPLRELDLGGEPWPQLRGRAGPA